MADKNSFVLYTDYIEDIEELENDERGSLFTAIMLHAAGRELPEMSRVVKAVFNPIRRQLDRDREKYEETCRKRSESGRKGGRPKANGFNNKAKKANGFSEKQSEAKKPDNDTENDTDNDLKKENKEKATRFSPPTQSDVQKYCSEKGYSIDAERFVDFYESKGWMVGKNKMKDWKASVRNWVRGQRKGLTAEPKKIGFNNFNGSDIDIDDLERKLLNSN